MERLAKLREIDRLCEAVFANDPAIWLNRATKSAFNGKSPIANIVQYGDDGIQQVLQHLMDLGLPGANPPNARVKLGQLRGAAPGRRAYRRTR